MSGLFPEIGRVPLPDVGGVEQGAPEVFDEVSTDMVAAMMNARLDGQDHVLGVLAGHSNRMAAALDGVQSDDIVVESDQASGTSRWELPEDHYEDSSDAGLVDTGLADFKLYLIGGDITMAPGHCSYYQGAADTWDEATITE